MRNMKSFAMTGAAGYVAPRHMKAIKNNNGTLVAALDPNDSVGQMDRYFPEVLFFKDFERFERHINKLCLAKKSPDYLSICAPNHLHDTHCRFALKNDMHAICEKPLVLNPWNLDILEKAEEESGRKICNILQLRLHPEIQKLKRDVENSPDKFFEVQLNYVTPRGPWYHVSWKGDVQKSGGIATNIGVHFFDMLIWIFGAVKENHVFEHNPLFAGGRLFLEKAKVDWFLSIKAQHVQMWDIQTFSTYRSVRVNGQELEFSKGFEDLHDKSYHQILNNKGFGIKDVRPSIELIHSIRNTPTDQTKTDGHMVLKSIKQMKT